MHRIGSPGTTYKFNANIRYRILIIIYLPKNVCFKLIVLIKIRILLYFKLLDTVNFIFVENVYNNSLKIRVDKI